MEIKGNYGQYESKINDLRRENEEMKRNIA